MRRDISGNKKKFIQRKCFDRYLTGNEVREMRRVEGSTEDTDAFHGQ
jgi:hypothetical protein